jgi:hypothetical protein
MKYASPKANGVQKVRQRILPSQKEQIMYLI